MYHLSKSIYTNCRLINLNIQQSFNIKFVCHSGKNI